MTYLYISSLGSPTRAWAETHAVCRHTIVAVHGVQVRPGAQPIGDVGSALGQRRVARGLPAQRRRGRLPRLLRGHHLSVRGNCLGLSQRQAARSLFPRSCTSTNAACLHIRPMLAMQDITPWDVSQPKSSCVLTALFLLPWELGIHCKSAARHDTARMAGQDVPPWLLSCALYNEEAVVAHRAVVWETAV